MSLFIVGSCSRITNSIVANLVSKNLYGKIVIGDMFPTYCAFQRYYKLRENVAQIKNGNTLIKPVKLVAENDIYLWAKRADHILYITHDYYLNVTSKTKLMEITADAAKDKANLLYVTPIEYDQFRYANPEEKYQEAVQAVKKKCPQATFLRTDVVRGAELHSYANSEKYWLSKYLLWNGVKTERQKQLKCRFEPRLVSQETLGNSVAELLTKEVHGKDLFLHGEKAVPYKDFKLEGPEYVKKCPTTISQFRKVIEKYKPGFSKAEEYSLEKAQQQN